MASAGGMAMETVHDRCATGVALLLFVAEAEQGDRVEEIERQDTHYLQYNLGGMANTSQPASAGQGDETAPDMRDTG